MSPQLCYPYCRPWWARDDTQWQCTWAPVLEHAPRLQCALPFLWWKITEVPTSDFEALDSAPFLQMFFDDLVQITFINEGVPNSLRINHQHRAVFEIGR